MTKKYFETNVKITPISRLSLLIHITIFCPFFKAETEEAAIQIAILKS